MTLEAHYFDGLSSRRQSVRLSADHASLLIEGAADGGRAIPVADVQVSERQGQAPRTLRFKGEKSFCEVAQSQELEALLTELGYRPSVVVRMQDRWRWALASFVGIVLIFVAGYFWGLPWGAKVLAPHVPVSAMRPISAAALEQLDKFVLEPSALPEERQEKLREGFRQLVAADPDLLPYDGFISLGFRAAPKIGPNAFALPDGQIVLFDEMVKVLHEDDEILAVLAHELGHLSKRHGIRQLVQGSVVAAVAAAWLGDISVAASTLGAVLLESGYSRDMEREADDYAAGALERQGKSPDLLANALAKMEKAHRKEMPDSDQNEEDEGENKFLDWISSHPDTAERIRRLRSP
ncbi:MAG: M48 family metallopeptidase [Zoogloeaceae bacterium]|jgi:Zn-dependent protease with chaperone function|nr:M48 family metallopeptidase [Zoogloeaceae bacterium]